MVWTEKNGIDTNLRCVEMAQVGSSFLGALGGEYRMAEMPGSAAG